MKQQNFIIESILRPQKHIERKIKKDIKKQIFKRFQSKTYENSIEINEIIKYDMDFYMKILEENILVFEKAELINIALNEYEKAATIVRECKYNYELKLIVDDLGWEKFGPIFRRAMKFVAEKALMIDSKGKNLNRHKKEDALSKIFIAAEEISKLYMNSEAVYNIFPNECILILNENEDIYFDLKCKDDEFMKKFNEKINVFSKVKFNIVEEEANIVETFLGTALKEELGVTYKEVTSILINIVFENGEFGAKKILKKDLIENIVVKYKITYEQVEKILNGFIINKNNLLSEERKIYKPKQEYRALYRGIFEVEEDGGIYLNWSTGMALENIMLMMDKVKFKYIPKEWRSKKIDKASESTSNEFGKKFEFLVKEQLENKNIIGDIGFLKRIGDLQITKEVGEIDYLGIDIKNKKIILGECKYISSGSEPRYWSDDIDKFTKKNGYIDKFNKKIAFINENFDNVKMNLKRKFKIKENIDDFELRTVLITYYPTIMELLCEEFEVENLSGFLDKY